ncbi:hypothetical protein [Rhizobium sp. BG4]|uniref:hypothetical protein n=1 Tax=Rhizobium sp. BG4 TaxID=2613770 RepID=UPI00193E6F6B|nr:hypothetical protein [Rhizobium sp. BG4]QRM44012.1 hypothetical protein F2982_11450 [Rhizobium sp. BG4]
MTKDIEKFAAMATEEYVRWLAAGNSSGTLSEHAVAGLRKHFADVLNDYASGSYPSPISHLLGSADDDETYEIGKRDGYSEAVQQIDQLTGGDGEYRYCTDHDPDRHTPGPAEMIQRIVDRFETLNLLHDAEKTGRDQEWGISAAPRLVGIDDLRKRIAGAIFDPGATEGVKGDRHLTTWQTDAVMRAIASVPHVVGSEHQFRDFCDQLIAMFDFNKLEHSVCDEDMDLVEHIRAALASTSEAQG